MTGGPADTKRGASGPPGTNERRKAVLASVEERADALLVTAPGNVRYLSGFTGSNGQFLLAPAPALLTDARYAEQSSAEAPDVERVIYQRGQQYEALRDALSARGVRRLAFEAGHPERSTRLSQDAAGYVTVLDLDDMRSALGDVELLPTSGLVEAARVRKDDLEVGAVRRAQRIAENAVVEVLRSFDGGTEAELALSLEWAIRTAGAEGVSFDVLVASGPHAALPHARPRREPMDSGLVLVDIGARVDGYCSDMTRTYFVGGVADPLPRVHGAVVRALEAACAVVSPGTRCADVDRAARDVLEAEGFGDVFLHGTGHGVGLDIHEMPRLSPIGEGVLEPGMIVTVEPGVYLPGIGGVRVEDLLVVTADGADNLTALPRGPEPPR